MQDGSAAGAGSAREVLPVRRRVRRVASIVVMLFQVLGYGVCRIREQDCLFVVGFWVHFMSQSFSIIIPIATTTGTNTYIAGKVSK